MLKLDPHIHSEYSSDCLSSIDNILKKSIDIGLDIIAISDHDTIEGSVKAIEKTSHNEDILVVPSIEISSLNGHILGFGCTDLIPKGLSAFETIDLIHDNAGLAIIPHPYCFYRHGLFCDEDPEKLIFDAMEIRNARFILGYCNMKAKSLSTKNNIPQLGASDAHFPDFIGDCFTEIKCEKNINSVLKAVKKGTTRALGKGTSNINLSMYLFNKNIRKIY